MRKLLLSLLTLLVFGLCSNAQKISIIPKVGMTIAKMNLSNDLDGGNLKSITGLLFGGGVNIKVNEDFFSVQGELLYIQKGVKSHRNSPGVTINKSTKLNYLEIPILAKITFGSDNIKCFINAGPSLGFILGGRLKEDGSTFGINYKRDGKIIFGDAPSNYIGEDEYYSNDEATKTDIGLLFGGGMGYNIGPGMLLCDVRYGLGLTNFIKQPENNSNFNNTSKHRVLTLSFGYFFPITK